MTKTLTQPLTDQTVRHNRHFQLIVDVHLLLLSDGDLLLGRRANTGYGDGAYEPPSGRLAERETLVEAAVRVAAAQVGIEIDPAKVSLAHVLHDVSGQGRMAFFLTADDWTGDAGPAAGNPVAGDTVSGNPVAGDTAAGNPVSGNPAPGNLGTRSYNDFGWFPLADLPANMIDRARVAVRNFAAGARFSTYPAFGM